MAKEKSAAAAWVAHALSQLDARMDTQHVQRSAQEVENSDQGEETYHWSRFALLREVERLGLPPSHAH